MSDTENGPQTVEADIVRGLRLTDPEFQATDPAVLQRRAWAAADEIVCLRRQLDFLETLADGGEIMVNGTPWREMFARFNALVGDPVTL